MDSPLDKIPQHVLVLNSAPSPSLSDRAAATTALYVLNGAIAREDQDSPRVLLDKILQHLRIINSDQYCNTETQTKDSPRPRDLLDKILQHVLILDSAPPPSLSSRAAATTTFDVRNGPRRDGTLSTLVPSFYFVCVMFSFYCHVAELADILNCHAVPVIMRLLFYLRDENSGQGFSDTFKYDVQRGCALVLTLLSFQPKYQRLIVDAGALPHLVDLLRVHKAGVMSQALLGILKTTAGAITYLAYENSNIKTLVRNEGGIPPLVELLEFNDSKVQVAAAGALRILAFRNYDNANQIVDCNALPTLVLMLAPDDPTIHYEAVGLIRNLVHSLPNIKEALLEAGALQPVIWLLSSSCLKSQREATLLLGQFVELGRATKVQIAERGAVRPLVDMLTSSDEQLSGMSAFALGRLAQDPDNQADITYNGGIEPLLNLLGSKSYFVQHNAAFTLYGLAVNEDNVADIIKAGGLQKLLDGHFNTIPTKKCVAITLKKLEDKMHGQVLKHLMNLMRFADKGVQRLVAIALAHLCSPNDRKTIFIVNNGLELLLDLLESANLKHKSDASTALYKLATKATRVYCVFHAPPSFKLYSGEQYVNNPNVSDVTFLVEGKRFYAHRGSLKASSDVFRAMFDQCYMESDAQDIEIPNIKWDVFELMMRFIYTGTIDVNLDIAEDLLSLADQYLLDNLKSLCEHAISQDISVDNVSLMYEMSEAFNATSLRNVCILFFLEQFDKLSVKPWYSRLVCRIAPGIRKFFSDLFEKYDSADS
ncbi:ARM REPEAT PROTEIN INTERACTING WITH ABF2-like [Lotus japonicus]|uniref:ARM REPEAT PROTEIN INTERACTING WITH ABF2-like n=1 Tax=Lotus japonicus TaxID=34305 RepID=UPI00258A93C1|nr:ARM REPEAT PROTEIN INTERACTING WITH ABF2-like [Lotus japonicus]